MQSSDVAIVSWQPGFRLGNVFHSKSIMPATGGIGPTRRTDRAGPETEGANGKTNAASGGSCIRVPGEAQSMSTGVEICKGKCCSVLGISVPVLICSTPRHCRPFFQPSCPDGRGGIINL